MPTLAARPRWSAALHPTSLARAARRGEIRISGKNGAQRAEEKMCVWLHNIFVHRTLGGKRIYIYVCIYVYNYIYTYMLTAYTQICIYLYTHRQTDGQTDRQNVVHNLGSRPAMGLFCGTGPGNLAPGTSPGLWPL